MKSALISLLILIIAALALAYTFGYVVYPGEMGVRQITFGPYQGFSQKALPPGYHWSVPFYSRIHILPHTIQQMNFLGELERQRDSYGPLEVQTTDGSSVFVDVTVLYRFYDEPVEKQHGGPAGLITDLAGEAGWLDRIRTAAINELKQSLGRLSTSDFYNPYEREKEVARAQTAMNARLQPYGIRIEDVLLRRYLYAEKRIDDAIRQKNLQVQEERLNAAKSRFSEAYAKIEAASAEGDKKIKTLQVEGETKSVVMRSEGELYETRRRAEGDLLLAKAEADVERLRAEALGSPGGDVYLGRRMAPLLGTLRGGGGEQGRSL